MPGKRSPSEAVTQFYNCRILRDHKIIREDLWVRDGKILNPEKLFFEEKAQAEIQIDCGSAIIAPGFIDVQINGAFGIDFSYVVDDFKSGLAKVAKGLLPHGVTSFCPTVVTSPAEMYRKILPQIERTAGSKEGAGILGIHIEGPFISHEKKGAHPEQYIRDLQNGFQGLLDMYGSLDNTSILTLAPEIAGSTAVIEELVKRGIKVSLGHSVANLAEGEKAVCAGASFITHLFNAMLPFHHRDPHLVGLLASDQIPKGRTVYYGMITDGIHTHPAALRIAHRTHPKGFIVVTDAIPAMGLSTGIHHIAHQAVEIKNGQAKIAGTNTLCGSIATMNECVQYFFCSTECSKEEALESGSLHAAEMLGIADRKGTLDYDTDADFVVLDDDLKVHATYIAGEKVWAGDEGKQPIERQISIN